MEITLKLNDVLNINQTLKTIIDNNNEKIDALLKFKLLGIMKGLENHVANFEIIRNEKIKEYGEEKEDGSVIISIDNLDVIKKFNDDLTAVLNSDVEINVSKLKAGEIFDKGIKSEYLVNLYPIIEE